MMKTDLGETKICDACRGKALDISLDDAKLCVKCKGTGMLEVILVTKTIERPYGKCKFPELNIKISEKRSVLIEKEGSEHPKEEGDVIKRVARVVIKIMDKRNKEAEIQSRNERQKRIANLNLYAPGDLYD